MAVIDFSEDGMVATGDTAYSTTSDDDGATVVPTGANNPFNYEVEDGEVQETTVGGNSIADVVPSIGYDDTSVDEAAMTSDEPLSTDEIIEKYSSQGSGDGDGVVNGGVPSMDGLPGGGLLLAGLAVVGAVVLGGG